MTDRAAMSRTMKVFVGYDAGDHTLPKKLIDARANHQRVTKAVQELPEPAVSEWDAQQNAAADFVEGGVFDVDAVRRARDAQIDHELRGALLRQAQETTAEILVGTLRATADEVIAEHLAPRQAEILDSAAKAVGAYREHGITAADLLHAPKPARDAYSTVNDLLRSFTVVRRARESVLIATDAVVEHDTHHYFSTIRNCEALWPEITGRLAPSTPPWPTEPLDFLHWLTGPDVEAWCPTTDEQDARWWEVFGKRVEQTRANRNVLQGYRELMTKDGPQVPAVVSGR